MANDLNNVILLLGDTGTGKSSSVRKLDPSKTFYINIKNQPLPFKSSGYNTCVSQPEFSGNMFVPDTSDPMCYQKINSTLRFISDKQPQFNSIVIDDFQFIQGEDYMRRCTNTVGSDVFKMYKELAQHPFLIIKQAIALRKDLDVFILSHTEERDGIVKMKVIGKMLDSVAPFESLVNIVLHSLIVENDGVLSYKFLTNRTQTYLAKSPIDMFSELYIDNDLQAVKNVIGEYYAN